MKKILFIINPRAGTGSKKTLEELIKSHIDIRNFNYKVEYTNARFHATELAKKAVLEHYEIVAVAGGDGSINETAKALTHTNTAMAIIPCGSGNGLARHLKIPMNIAKALKAINTGKIKLIDTATINGHCFTMVAGCGFDSHVADKFAAYIKRGFYAYIKLILKEFHSFKSADYEINIDGKKIKKNAFMLSISNAEQIGNNACIAPGALIDDGLLNVTILKKFPLYAAPHLIYRIFSRGFHQSKYTEVYTGKNILIKQESEFAQADGDCFKFGRALNICVDPLSLRVIVPN